MKTTHQKGFIFRQENCVGCGACTVACQVHNELPEDVRFRKIERYEIDGPDHRRDVWFTHSCMHCDNPTCLSVCPANAFVKRSDGIVVLDRAKCTGCGLCKSACPYDAISISKRDGKAAKCNMCVELLDQGKQPACVDGCPVNCITVDYVDQVLKSNSQAKKEGVGFKDSENGPNMVVIKKRL